MREQAKSPDSAVRAADAVNAVAGSEDARAHSAVPADSVGRRTLRGIGQTLITFGVVVLLFIVYEAFITSIFTAQKQAQLNEQLHDDWESDPAIDPQITVADIPIGDAFAILRIPAFGADYARVVLEGTTPAVLKQGPGHYPGTAMPGEVGNFSVAGHRVGRGSPFLDLDKLEPGDAIVVETAAQWFVYRVIGDAASGSFTDADYPGIEGRHIVKPSAYEAISPVPGDDDAAPAQSLLTLTTCHPKFSAAERMIIHAHLDGDPLTKAQYPEPGDLPALSGG